MLFKDILADFRKTSFSERHKGARFERLMKRWLLSDRKYADNLKNVWLWDEFPSKTDFGGSDVGIDLVAETNLGDFWAIQCKCYDENVRIDKPEVDTFLSTSSKYFSHPETGETITFDLRVWISTTTNWTSKAEESLESQTPPVIKIDTFELEDSAVEWASLFDGNVGDKARENKKEPRSHQVKAIANAYMHYAVEKNERGKLIMACGTGKTYTSLKMMEKLTGNKGTILFLVPSIALLNQSLNDWYVDSEKKLSAICVCSDSQASLKARKDDDAETIVDLALPASTNIESVVRQFKSMQEREGMLVVFSTYQSIDVVSNAQQVLKSELGDKAKFDFIVCDEAHRTTGFTEKGKDDSAFVKVHDNDNIDAKHRLYMTATPRMYGDSAKVKASEEEIVLWDMNDESIYGKEFYRIGFGEAVELGLLSDYKVMVLTIDDNAIPEGFQELITDPNKKELTVDSVSQLIGCINGLSKRLVGKYKDIKQLDPLPMKRAVAFCQSIKDSKSKTKVLNLSGLYKNELTEEENEEVVNINCRHVDGGMGAGVRGEMISWLKSENTEPNECRILSNVRCLSEGVNVPALDAVLFLSARNSQIDVVQSVGRVMRRADNKKYGYIIIPVVVPSTIEPEEALNNHENFKVVWNVLQALRSHDDRFNATVNKISLNKKKPDQIMHTHIGANSYGNDADSGAPQKEKDQSKELVHQFELRFDKMSTALYAKMVKKVGDRHYWENWAKDVGDIAQKLIARIDRLIDEKVEYLKAFNIFLSGLHANINPAVSREEAVEMLAQHIITRPVFDALFEEYSFAHNNIISQSMEKMLALLDEEALEKDMETLQKFYLSVQSNIKDIDNAKAKQHILKELYDKFFRLAFPKTTEKLGIVYTPIECVDFIIKSVEDVLNKEFGRSLSDENIHILDPFTGTGTFIVRLLQSGIIRKEDLLRKYMIELHANEIILLAYYVAAVNIENAFHDLNDHKYVDFKNICLTDTFQLGEESFKEGDLPFSNHFPLNVESVEKQKQTPIRVIIGNPPYSIGQASANDNSQNQSYPDLEKRIEETYVADSNAALSKSAYDSYIKAFRWSSDRLEANKPGVIAFITNGSWLDANGLDGFRKCIEKEFSSIYVFNLRGNQRTSGELSRKEGGKIFDSGSRAPIAITLLVKNPAVISSKAKIYYKDIGDYLDRKEKLNRIRKQGSILNPSLDLQLLKPNKYGDWINKRSDEFFTYIPMAPKKRFDEKSKSWFCGQVTGVSTSRDAWTYNYSKFQLASNIESMIDYYNQQRELYHNENKELQISLKNISWSRGLKNKLYDNIPIKFNEYKLQESCYRPFVSSNLYYDKTLVESPGLWDRLFVSEKIDYIYISICGLGSKKRF